MAQTPPCNAGDAGLIRHTTGQLKPRATTQEPRAATKTAKNKLRKEVIHLDSGRSKLLRAWKSIRISGPMCYIHFLCLRALMCKAEVWFWWRSRDKTPYLWGQYLIQSEPSVNIHNTTSIAVCNHPGGLHVPGVSTPYTWEKMRNLPSAPEEKTGSVQVTYLSLFSSNPVCLSASRIPTLPPGQTARSQKPWELTRGSSFPSLWPVRNQSVNSRQESKASSVFTAALHHSHYHLSSASHQISGGIRFSYEHNKCDAL